MNKTQPTIETCFAPPLFQHILTKENYAVVVIDILRASTAICTAFKNGALEIIPLAGIDETKKYRPLGYLIAGERDGIVIAGADFGNSPFNFTEENVKGKKIVITTTNGTQTIAKARVSDTLCSGLSLIFLFWLNGLPILIRMLCCFVQAGKTNSILRIVCLLVL